MPSTDSSPDCPDCPGCNPLCARIDRALDYLTTDAGLIQIRNAMVPVILVGGIFMIAIGSTWAHLLKPECGRTLDSAKFNIYTDGFTGERILEGNACPGYDWSGQKTFNTAGQYNFKYALSSEPRIATTPFYVGLTNPVPGPIGVALNGIPIYNPSTSEGTDSINAQKNLFDYCGGFNAAYKDFSFNAPITGYYHYLELPGTRSLTQPTSTSPAPAQSFCKPSNLWYNESHHSHSPLAGFMADGVPIYGPYSTNGALPTDLDECGGHDSDDYKYYHYHFQLTYPYSVNCLKGCVNGAMNPKIHTDMCMIDNTVSYDYTSLLSYSTTYGGSGKNSNNIVGPACLITFGILLVIISIVCFAVFYKPVPAEVKYAAKLPTANNEEFGYVDTDNVL